MKNANFIKTLSGYVPCDPDTEAWYIKQKVGSVARCDIATYRNYKFLQKFFTLLTMAYDMWQPGEINSKYGKPEKNFERFKEDVTILAGYYHNVVRIDGSTRVEADSISFAKMDEETFGKLYSSVIDVLIKRIPVMNKMSPEDVEETVKKILEFV